MRICALGLTLLAGVVAAQPSTFQVMVNGTTFQVDRYLPAGQPPFPIVALGHGFSNSKDNVRGLAQVLQSDGVVVVAPQFPVGNSDHARNAAVLLAAIDATVTAGLADAQRIGLGGHSAGGLAAFLAAAQRPSRVLVLLDPVDSNGLGLARVANVTAPTLFAFAPPQQCNTQNNAAMWFARQTGQRARFTVPMANHCDPQEPSNVLCTGGCGFATWNMQRSAVFKRQARAFVGQFLLGGPCASALIAADQTAGAIAQVDVQLAACSPADGGSTGGGSAGGGSAGGGSAGGGSAGGGSAGAGSAGGMASGGAGGGAGGSSAGGSAQAGGTAGGSVAGGSVSGGNAAGGTTSTGGGGNSSGGAAGGQAGGSSSCSAATCSGCCNGGQCVQVSDQACGAAGSACAICRADQRCEQGSCATPTAGCSCGGGSSVLGSSLALVALLWSGRRRLTPARRCAPRTNLEPR